MRIRKHCVLEFETGAAWSLSAVQNQAPCDHAFVSRLARVRDAANASILPKSPYRGAFGLHRQNPAPVVTALSGVRTRPVQTGFPLAPGRGGNPFDSVWRHKPARSTVFVMRTIRAVPYDQFPMPRSAPARRCPGLTIRSPAEIVTAGHRKILIRTAGLRIQMTGAAPWAS